MSPHHRSLCPQLAMSLHVHADHPVGSKDSSQEDEVDEVHHGINIEDLPSIYREGFPTSSKWRVRCTMRRTNGIPSGSTYGQA